MKKKYRRKIIIAIVVIAALEIVLRLAGFGKIPTYYVSKKYEYAMHPNQDLKRFGKKIYINQNGMRSGELREGTIRILKFGDSVLNGGVAIDQSETMSALLEADLNNSKSKDYQVLNVSAGSWGPDNAFAWMEQHGDFQAKVIVLVFSSHDWQDQMSFQDVVGKIPFYPAKNPPFAIVDALNWASSRAFNTVRWNELGWVEGGVPNNYDHNLGWDNFLAYAESKNIPLLIYHHADREECVQKKYNSMGMSLQKFLKEKDANVILGLEAGLTDEDYRDVIHPNLKGTSKIEQAIKPHVLQILQKKE